MKSDKTSKRLYRYEPPYPGHRIKLGKGVFVRQGECVEMTDAEVEASCPDYLHPVGPDGARLDAKVIPPAPVVVIALPTTEDDDDEPEPEAPKKRSRRKPRR